MVAVQTWRLAQWCVADFAYALEKGHRCGPPVAGEQHVGQRRRIGAVSETKRCSGIVGGGGGGGVGGAPMLAVGLMWWWWWYSLMVRRSSTTDRVLEAPALSNISSDCSDFSALLDRVGVCCGRLRSGIGTTVSIGYHI